MTIAKSERATAVSTYEAGDAGTVDYVQAYLKPIMSSRFEQNKLNKDLSRLRSRLGRRRDQMLESAVIAGSRAAWSHHGQKD